MAVKKRSSAKKTAKKASPKVVKKVAKKKRMGRPPKKPSERKAIAVNLRVTPAEKDFLEQTAQAHGMSMTALILASVTFFTETR
jgi:predicted HicB family RNase H-like nuclease